MLEQDCWRLAFEHVHAAVTKLQAKLRLSGDIIDLKENQNIMSCFSSKFILVIQRRIISQKR